MEKQRCNYCTKFSAFYWCPKCESRTFCGKGCYRLDKGHHESCPYLIPKSDEIKIEPAKNFTQLLGKFMSFLLYHWHRIYGIGYAECIIVSSDTTPTEFRVTFNKDISKLGDNYVKDSLNFAVVEINKDVLEKQGLSLLSGKRTISNIVDLSGFDFGIYPIETAQNHYYYFSTKFDMMIIGNQVYGIGLPNKTVIGVHMDKGKTVYLS